LEPLANFKAEYESPQSLQQAQLFADHFAVLSHNDPQEHFLQSPSLRCKGAANSLSWKILQVTPLF
jgi:hypothetical protein